MQAKKAFTLIEMLIVITIIAVLAVIAVGAYGGVQRSAQIDLMANNLVSSLKMQQGLAKSGRIGLQQGKNPPLKEANKSKCYGMNFKKNGGEVEKPEITYVETPYYAVKDDKADFCDLNDVEQIEFESPLDFELFMMEMYESERDELLILFKPPFARIAVGTLNKVESPRSSVTPFINFGISLPNRQNAKYFRFDASTGLTERYYEEQV